MKMLLKLMLIILLVLPCFSFSEEKVVADNYLTYDLIEKNDDYVVLEFTPKKNTDYICVAIWLRKGVSLSPSCFLNIKNTSQSHTETDDSTLEEIAILKRDIAILEGKLRILEEKIEKIRLGY